MCYFFSKLLLLLIWDIVALFEEILSLIKIFIRKHRWLINQTLQNILLNLSIACKSFILINKLLLYLNYLFYWNVFKPLCITPLKLETI